MSAVQNYEIFVKFHQEAGIMAEKSGVQSVERIFQLIEHLAAHPTGVSLQRLAEETVCWPVWSGLATSCRTRKTAITG